jgi:outer membrane protein
MFLRMGLRPLLVCSALFVVSQIASAQAKIAVVDIQKAVFDSAEIKKASDDMQKTFKPRQDQAKALEDEINSLAKQLQDNGDKMTPGQQADLQATGQRKQRELQHLNEDLTNDSEAYRNDVLQKTTAKMNQIIKQVAEAKGIDLVVEIQTTHYFKPAMDITADVIAAYDKAYPGASAPAAPPAAKK